MRLRGTLPEMLILGIVPADIGTYRAGFSETLAGPFDAIVEKVAREIRGGSDYPDSAPSPDGSPK